MKEGTPILEHMNTLDKIVSDLLWPDIKNRRWQIPLLLASLPPTYDHLMTTMLCERETNEKEESNSFELINHEEAESRGGDNIRIGC